MLLLKGKLSDLLEVFGAIRTTAKISLVNKTFEGAR